MIENLKASQKEIEKLQVQVAQQSTSEAASEVKEVNGIKVVSREVKNADRGTLRQVADDIRNKLQSGIVVLGSASGDKVSLLVMVTQDLTDRIKANEINPSGSQTRTGRRRRQTGYGRSRRQKSGRPGKGPGKRLR